MVNEIVYYKVLTLIFCDGGVASYKKLKSFAIEESSSGKKFKIVE
jgi:hypothetical protein